MPADLESILRLEVPLTVEIATRPMRVRDVSALSPGAIIELPKLADERLEVTIGGRRIGSGTAVKVGENYGVRVIQVGTMRQRIHAMGPTHSAPAPTQEGNLAEPPAEDSDDPLAEGPPPTEPESGADPTPHSET